MEGMQWHPHVVEGCASSCMLTLIDSAHSIQVALLILTGYCAPTQPAKRWSLLLRSQHGLGQDHVFVGHCQALPVLCCLLQLLHPQVTLQLSFLACALLREPITFYDILSWAVDAHLPYLELPGIAETCLSGGSLEGGVVSSGGSGFFGRQGCLVWSREGLRERGAVLLSRTGGKLVAHQQ
jgi:hypothetical protein